VLALASACGAPTTSSGDTGSGSTSGGSEPTPSRTWLENIRQGDRLEYEVTTRDQGTFTVEVVVERLERGPDRTAACLVPARPIETNTGMDGPHWLVGDANGLSRVEGSAAGCATDLPTIEESQVWRLPSDWSDLEAHRSRIGSWAIDELDLRVEGPIRGDRCARFVTETDGVKTYLVVCANVGMAELERLAEGDFPTERWRLLSIRSPVQQIGP
jgi:hypothetical protein